MADKRTSKPTPSARATKEPVKPAAKPASQTKAPPAAKAPAGAKALAEKASAKTVKIVKKPTGNQAVVVRKTRTPVTLIALPASERPRLVAEAAYYLAEARGFAPGNAESDWHAAEQVIARRYRFT